MAPTSPEISEPIPPEDESPRSETDALLDRLNDLMKDQKARPDDPEVRQQIERVKAELRSFATGEKPSADVLLERLSVLLRGQKESPDDSAIQSEIAEVRSQLAEFARGDRRSADDVVSEVEEEASTVESLRRREGQIQEGVPQAHRSGETFTQTLDAFDTFAVQELLSGYAELSLDQKQEIQDLVLTINDLVERLKKIGVVEPRVQDELNIFLEKYRDDFSKIVEEEKIDSRHYLFEERKHLFEEVLAFLQDLMDRFQRTRKTES